MEDSYTVIGVHDGKRYEAVKHEEEGAAREFYEVGEAKTLFGFTYGVKHATIERYTSSAFHSKFTEPI
jgi:hypothetical protein